MNTPDTEWEKKFDEIYGDYLSGYFCCDGRECGCNGTNVKTEIFLYIQYLLSSRDTYWKERVRKEVEGIRKPETTFLKEGDETWDYSHIIAHNLALDTLLDNLK